MNIPPRRLLPASAVAIALLASTLSPAPAAAAGCGDTPGKWHLDLQSGEQFREPIENVGVWRPGPKAPPPIFGIPVPPVEADAAQVVQLAEVGIAGDGRKVADFERYQIEGDLFYALVFAAGEAEEKLVVNLAKGEGVVTAIGEQNGFHLADFEAYRAGQDWHFDALFQQGAAQRFFETGVKGSEVGAKLAAKHLKEFEVLGRGPGEPTFALLLADGPQDQAFVASLDADGFHDEVHQMNEAGYRLEDVELWTSHLGATRFSALFVKAGLGDHLSVRPCGDTDCGKKTTFELSVTHIGSLVAALQTKKPALHLVDLELPLGGAAAPLLVAKKKGKTGAAGSPPRKASGPGERVLSGSPPDFYCSHAGVLHDAGTDGPP